MTLIHIEETTLKKPGKYEKSGSARSTATWLNVPGKDKTGKYTPHHWIEENKGD